VAGKAVLITGASRGIGAAAARAFAAAGAKLGLAGRPGDELRAVADETGAELLACDVTEATRSRRRWRRCASGMGGSTC
jgi:NADP-dependent 3-hydroxy acid dehydrogenase YdfG